MAVPVVDLEFLDEGDFVDVAMTAVLQHAAICHAAGAVLAASASVIRSCASHSP